MCYVVFVIYLLAIIVCFLLPIDFQSFKIQKYFLGHDKFYNKWNLYLLVANVIVLYIPSILTVMCAVITSLKLNTLANKRESLQEPIVKSYNFLKKSTVVMCVFILLFTGTFTPFQIYSCVCIVNMVQPNQTVLSAVQAISLSFYMFNPFVFLLLCCEIRSAALHLLQLFICKKVVRL